MFKNLINISCKKAGFLAGKKEEAKSSFLENLKLKLHYKICAGCRRFVEQTSRIGIKANHAHEHSDAFLTPEKKEKIKQFIRSQKLELLLPALFLFSRYAYCLGLGID